MVDLDTRLLRAFVAVAEELNFTRAAARLFLAQQALSAQVRQLETRLGVRLFERTTRRVEPDRGRRAAAAARAWRRWRRSTRASRELEAARRARARDAAGRAVGDGDGAAWRARRCGVRRAPSRRELVVSNAGLNQPAAGLNEGTVDVAFVRPPFVDDGHLDGHGAHRGALRRAARGPSARRARVRAPEDSSASRGSGSRAPTRGRARSGRSRSSAAGSRCAPARAINSFEEAFGAVAAGLAITCQAESAVRAVGAGFPQLRFVPLRGAPPAQVAVAWRTAHETALARAFVRDRARGQPRPAD